MSSWKCLSIPLVLVLALAWAGSSGAAVVPMDLGQLVEGSEAVLHGRVLSLTPHWDEGKTRISTTVSVQPIDYMKGDLGGGPIQFEMPGGAVGNVSLAVSDVPEFEVGEEVVLFLRSEYFRVVGWNQGKLTVKDGIVGGTGMSLERFATRVAELAGMPSGQGVTGEDGTVVREAQFSLPPGAVGDNSAPPQLRRPEAETSPGTDVTIMTQTFEGTFPSTGWTLIDQNGTGHQWGKETYRVHGGSYSMWECAAGANALPSGSDYPNGMRTWALYGPFDLSDASAAQLTFWRSVQTADANDYVFWGSSGDGSSYSGYISYLGSGAWTSTTYDLAANLGDNSVWIAFMFESDASGVSKGAFIDDVALVKTLATGTPATINSITPNTGPSGAHFSVTIDGTGFGTAGGGSTVRFVRNPATADYVYADVITSWTDTQIVCEVPERASSGNVNVVIAGNPGVGKPFTVTYGASSTWWQTGEPMGEDIAVNPNCADETAEATLGAVVSGLQEWNAAGGATFSFSYGGPTSATGYSYNSANEVCWGSTGGSLATTYSWFNSSTGAMLENDTVFDDVWAWSASGLPSRYDIQSVMTHELGHWLRLFDLYGTADAGKTMYGYISVGQTGPSTLETEDKDGIQYLYGSETVNITTRSLPDAQLAAPYSEYLAAVGGATPYTFAFRSGPALPPGLSIGTDGDVHGTPTSEGLFFFNVRVTDNDLAKDSQIIPLEVVGGEPVCGVAPTELDFGSLAIGESASLSFTISNTGGGTLDGSVSESCADFSITSGAGVYSIPPGGSREVTVKFQPMSAGTQACTIETGTDLCTDVSCVGVGTGALPNTQGKWALHYAGPHNSKANTCAFEATQCTDIVVDAPSGVGRYDIYVIAADVDGIAGTRYGLECEGPFYFYGWTKCCNLEIPTAGWPGCGEANAQTWSTEQPGPHVTVGILDLYVYPGGVSLSTCPDQRVGFAEWCDATQPSPICVKRTRADVFGKIGFGVPGYNPCSIVPVELAGFEAEGTEEGIVLRWSSAEGADFGRFFVHRSVAARDGEYVIVNDDPVESGDGVDRRYSYLDADVIPGTLYYYKLEAVRRGGGSAFFGPYAVKAYEGRAAYWVSQNVPNPLSRGGATTINYSVAAAGVVSIRILDAAGRLVRTISERASAGANSVTWDGRGADGRRVPSGVYFYEIKAGSFSAERKMLVVD